MTFPPPLSRNDARKLAVESLERCLPMPCPHCNSPNTRRNGRYRGRQRWLCKDCGKQHIEPSDKPAGRPPVGDKPMTAAERKRRSRARKKDQRIG